MADNGHRQYPYLQRDWLVEFADEVWCSRIPYIAMPQGHAYLCAVIDWHSSKVRWRNAEAVRKSSTPTKAASSPRRNGREGSKGWGSP